MNREKLEPAAYLTTVEAADLMRLSPRTLERLRVNGTGPRFIKAGPGKRARVLYRVADLQQWLEATTYHSTSEYEYLRKADRPINS